MKSVKDFLPSGSFVSDMAPRGEVQQQQTNLVSDPTNSLTPTPPFNSICSAIKPIEPIIHPTPTTLHPMQLFNYIQFQQQIRHSFGHPWLGLPYPYKLDPRSLMMDPRLALYRPPEEPKPQHSYIGLIAQAILSHPDLKLVLSDIYQYILDHHPYFRNRGPGWRNSIRHNLSLNDCFIKAGRSPNGKGHYWAIHPANLDDFKKGDFRRRKAQRRVRKAMGLSIDDDDSPSPPPSPPTAPWPAQLHMVPLPQPPRRRQFDVASLLAPDDDVKPSEEEEPESMPTPPESPQRSHPTAAPYNFPPFSQSTIPLQTNSNFCSPVSGSTINPALWKIYCQQNILFQQTENGEKR